MIADMARLFNERGVTSHATPEQIQRGSLTIAPVEAGVVACLEPEFISIRAACRFSSIGRTQIYLLIRHGHLKSISLRKKGAARGRRLVSVASLRAYLNSFAEGEVA
jgi:hypothetical protein